MELNVRTFKENDVAHLASVFHEYLRTLTLDDVLRKELLDENIFLCKQKPESTFILEANKKTVGAACIKKLFWDSEHFDINIGRIMVIAFKTLPYDKAKTARMRLIDEVITYCKNCSIKCIICRIDADDIASAHALESRGFGLMDILVTFKIDLEDVAPLKEVKKSMVISVRPFKQSDVPLLMEIARRSFSKDHFHSDYCLPKEKSDELYAKWIKNCCGGSVDSVLVAENKGEITGFITCKVKKTYNNGVIDLVAVHPRFHGLGVGYELVLRALDWFKERVKVVYVGTQITNTAAMSMYQRAGFKYLRSEITFHKWT